MSPVKPSKLRTQWVTPFLFACIGILWIISASSAQRLIVAPLVVQVLIATIFLAVLQSGKVIPLDDVGAWYVPSVAAYGVLPLVAFLILDFQFADARLLVDPPSREAVGRIGWYHACYLATFAVTYVAQRGRSAAPRAVGIQVDRVTAVAVFALWGLCAAGVLAIGFVYDLDAKSYGDTYLLVQQLPLGVRQVLRFVLGIRMVLSLVVLAWVFAAYRQRRWVLFCAVVIIGTQTIVLGGARTPLVLLLAGSAVLYHRTVRPIATWKAYSGGVILFLLFMLLGVVRTLREDPTAVGVTMGLNVGEFESVFGNAVDLEQRKAAREFDILSPTLYLSELASAVPSQLVPFKKVDLSDWYIEEFYPDLKARGGGLAFGVVAQSIVGLGWVELLVRGVFVGVVFGWLHRAYKKRQASMWPTVAYLWLILLAYQSYRNVTLYPAGLFIQQFIPAVMLVTIARMVIVRAAVRQSGDGLTSQSPA